MKHLFIINPAAGPENRTEEASAVIHRLCRQRGLRYEVRVSTAPGECARIAREVALSGQALRIYACGGDGTLNEVIRGVAGYGNAAVTVFAGGSGNDFIKLFDDPRAFFDLSRLLDAEETQFDLIRCGEDWALNICSVGLDARIGADAARYKRLPLLHGFRAYLVSTVRNVIRGISQHYTVECDGEIYDGEFTMICACNGRWYGGGFQPVPEADPADGLLDVLLVKKVTRLQIARLIQTYATGRYATQPQLVRHLKTRHLRITSKTPATLNLDGEIRTITSADISIAPEKLRFFYPKGLRVTPQDSSAACRRCHPGT